MANFESVAEPLLTENETFYNTKNNKSSYESRHYQDLIFLILFFVNSLIIISIAISYGLTALISKSSKVIIVHEDGSQEYNKTNSYTPSVLILFGVLIIQSCSVSMSLMWIYLISLFMSSIAKALYISIIVVPMIFGIITFFSGYYIFGSILLIFALLISVISLMIKPNIDFASINLQVACISILEMPNIFYYSSLVLIAQIAYTCIWSIAAIGISTNNSEITLYSGRRSFDLSHQCTTYVYKESLELQGISLTCSSSTSSTSGCYSCICNGNLISNSSCFTPKVYGWSFFWLLLSFIWTSVICSNIIHCSTASSVSIWWKSSYLCNRYVRDGFVRSCTTSLGSICFASLLVSIIQTIRTICYFLFHKTFNNLDTNNISNYTIFNYVMDCCKSGLYFMLQFLERVITYFNRYALCVVAIHRCDFINASIIATNLFAQRGYNMLLNDSLIDIVLLAGPLVIGILSMCIAYIYSVMVALPHVYIIILTVFGLLSGYLVSLIIISIVYSAVAAIYVCYIDNPDILQVAHPDIADPMFQAWRKLGGGPNSNTRTEGMALQSSDMITLTSIDSNVTNPLTKKDRTIRGTYQKLETTVLNNNKNNNNNSIKNNNSLCGSNDDSDSDESNTTIMRRLEDIKDMAFIATNQLYTLINDCHIYVQSNSLHTIPDINHQTDEFIHSKTAVDNFEESFSV